MWNNTWFAKCFGWQVVVCLIGRVHLVFCSVHHTTDTLNTNIDALVSWPWWWLTMKPLDRNTDQYLLLCRAFFHSTSATLIAILGRHWGLSERFLKNIIVFCLNQPGSVFSYKLRYIVGFWLAEMAISTNQKPTIYRNLYENTGPDKLETLIFILSYRLAAQLENYIDPACRVDCQVSKPHKVDTLFSLPDNWLFLYVHRTIDTSFSLALHFTLSLTLRHILHFPLPDISVSSRI